MRKVIIDDKIVVATAVHDYWQIFLASGGVINLNNNFKLSGCGQLSDIVGERLLFVDFKDGLCVLNLTSGMHIDLPLIDSRVRQEALEIYLPDAPALIVQNT